jgi:two-component system, NtrC family, sensor kinase
MEMRIGRWFHKLPLKARLIWSYLVILAIGGLATSLVGSWIVSSTIMAQARRAVGHDFATARTIYDQRLDALRLSLQFAALDAGIQRAVSGEAARLPDTLEWIRREAGFDFLNLTDRAGRPPAGRPGAPAAGLSSVAVIREALEGRVGAGTELVPAALLEGESPGLGERARATMAGAQGEIDGMVLMAAAPVRGPDGEFAGALYGGVLLNANFGIVDHVWRLLSSEERRRAGDHSIVAIFQNDARISTSPRMGPEEQGGSARISSGIRDAVLRQGLTWRGRAHLMDEWHIGQYGPIRNHAGETVGMLAVALRESTYSSIRDRVILSFFAIALLGFMVIIGITYYMIRSITRPIGEMVAATRSITAGRFDQEVRSDSSGEIALLAESFNAMLKSLRLMRGDLEEWGRTLEQKVKQRTEELVAMQARVAQSERLASLGMLAAGVAHEVNNPLGGVLALTALTLEDMKEDDPNRENLVEVIRQTERCRDIVRRLLEFSRQSKGDIERADLNRILQDTLSLMTRQAQFFNIEVVTDLDPELPAVLADSSQFQQVFMNILMNAAQAMEERGTVRIATRAAQGAVEVSISDTGRGIPPGEVDRIFDPFFTTKESGQGTGLGLSIAYGIVTKHGGAISVRSEVGKGSTFIIRMPALSV